MDAEGLAVVVLAYGGGDRHRPLLESLIAEGIAAERIVVVHNPAVAGESAPSPPAGCALIETGSNLGYAGAMNLGLNRALADGAQLLLLLTHDARFRPGGAERLLAAMREQSGFGVLGPSLLLEGTEEPFSYGGRTDANGGASHLKAPPPAGPGGIAPCDWVDGGTMLLRREVIELVGGFDRRFWGYCEDSELCLRARRAGFGVGVVLAAEADQESGASRRPGAWAYLMTRNGLAYGRSAAGLRGLLAGAARALAGIGRNLARTGLRAAHLRRGEWRQPWALAAGAARGAVDFLRGRWGPPPPGLPGMGDLSNA